MSEVVNLEKALEKAKRKLNKSAVPLPSAVDWRASYLKMNQAPLDIEIGCGVGMHPIIYSKNNSDRFLVAIEHTKNKFESFQRRFVNHQNLKNLFPVHTNAISFVTHELKDAEVDRVFILYPNPYPKVSDRSKRFYAMPFMAEIVRCLRPGGTLHLASNVENYIKEAEIFLTDAFQFKLQSRSIYSGKPRTHFEKKYLARGETCFDLVFIK